MPGMRPASKVDLRQLREKASREDPRRYTYKELNWFGKCLEFGSFMAVLNRGVMIQALALSPFAVNRLGVRAGPTHPEVTPVPLIMLRTG